MEGCENSYSCSWPIDLLIFSKTIQSNVEAYNKIGSVFGHLFIIILLSTIILVFFFIFIHISISFTIKKKKKLRKCYEWSRLGTSMIGGIVRAHFGWISTWPLCPDSILFCRCMNLQWKMTNYKLLGVFVINLNFIAITRNNCN